MLFFKNIFIPAKRGSKCDCHIILLVNYQLFRKELVYLQNIGCMAYLGIDIYDFETMELDTAVLIEYTTLVIYYQFHKDKSKGFRKNVRKLNKIKLEELERMHTTILEHLACQENSPITTRLDQLSL